MGFLFAGGSWWGWVGDCCLCGFGFTVVILGFCDWRCGCFSGVRVVSIWFLMVRGFVAGVAGVLVLFRVLGSSGFGCWVGWFSS